jgi:hypothetical protein
MANRFVFVALLIAMSLLPITAPALAANPTTMTIGVHITLVNRWLDPAETEGLITPFMVLMEIQTSTRGWRSSTSASRWACRRR